MASSKPIIKMLYLSMDCNFCEKECEMLEDVLKGFDYTSYKVWNKNVLKVQTEMSALPFVRMVTLLLSSKHKKDLYGYWGDNSAAALLFKLPSDKNLRRSNWVFDTQSDVFVTSDEDDSLTRHELKLEGMVAL